MTTRRHFMASALAPVYYQAASYIGKIAKGSKPRDLPVIVARTVELWVNQRTAALIGCVIPEGVLLRASQVIQ